MNIGLGRLDLDHPKMFRLANFWAPLDGLQLSDRNHFLVHAERLAISTEGMFFGGQVTTLGKEPSVVDPRQLDAFVLPDFPMGLIWPPSRCRVLQSQGQLELKLKSLFM